MGKVKRLIFVGAESNNNKFYDMIEQDDGNFRAEWGRVGTKKNITIYSMSKWNSVYNEKIRKGYVDQTDLYAESSTKVEFIDIEDPLIRKLISTLRSYSSKSVQQNYNVSLDAVTESQLKEAQGIIDYLASNLSSSTDTLNKYAMDLFMVIPRKMKKVKDSLIISDRLDDIKIWISKQQDILDSLKSQVTINTQQLDSSNKGKNILEAMGIELYNINIAKEDWIKTMLGESAGFYKQAFTVVNKATEKRFDENLASKSDKTVMQMWHGSRNENWMSILETGLLIRPSNAVYSGSMFGDGIYGANKARKSIGYTSLRGSYWAKGSATSAYLAIFAFHVGKQKHIYRHDSSCYRLSKGVLDTEGFDSVFAHKGDSLLNDEFIVYSPAQTTVRHIVEIGN